jgi:hypothetical protein
MRIIVFLSPPPSYAILQIKPLFCLIISVDRRGGKLASKNRTFQHQTKRIASNAITKDKRVTA